ncbi:MAG: hotdog fold thioesterase, partial [Hyphomicrobiales bacterium]|nr:hotdog fold thioesterase [Hyphomicrobiales bacterium]
MTTERLARAAADAMWAQDKASRALGMAITEIAPGEATLTMPVSEQMVNGHGLCHGGYIFTLADSAFAFACNSH